MKYYNGTYGQYCVNNIIALKHNVPYTKLTDNLRWVRIFHTNEDTIIYGKIIDIIADKIIFTNIKDKTQCHVHIKDIRHISDIEALEFL